MNTPPRATVDFLSDIYVLRFHQPSETPVISIVTVNYFCASSITRLMHSLLPSSVPFEIIIVDNSRTNRGFGKANNLGAQFAKGKYLLIVNPDTVASPTLLQQLLDTIQVRGETCCIVPQLRDMLGNPYLSTTAYLGWKEMVVAHSLLDTFFPNNAISHHFWYTKYPLQTSRYVETASGAALFVSKLVFDNIDGFDEQFFMYFEDTDFCNRLRRSGGKIWFEAHIAICHTKAGATHVVLVAKTFFNRSRWLYSKKYFGYLPAILSEGWLRITATLSQKLHGE